MQISGTSVELRRRVEVPKQTDLLAFLRHRLAEGVVARFPGIVIGAGTRSSPRGPSVTDPLNDERVCFVNSASGPDNLTYPSQQVIEPVERPISLPIDCVLTRDKNAIIDAIFHTGEIFIIGIGGGTCNQCSLGGKNPTCKFHQIYNMNHKLNL